MVEAEDLGKAVHGRGRGTVSEYGRGEWICEWWRGFGYKAARVRGTEMRVHMHSLVKHEWLWLLCRPDGSEPYGFGDSKAVA